MPLHPQRTVQNRANLEELSGVSDTQNRVGIRAHPHVEKHEDETPRLMLFTRAGELCHHSQLSLAREDLCGFTAHTTTETATGEPGMEINDR